MKLFKFIPSQHVLPGTAVPKKAASEAPDWYKNGEKIIKAKDRGLEINVGGLRSCIPFLDAMNTGYLLVTPFDIEVFKTEDNKVGLKWDPTFSVSPVNVRSDESGSTIPRPNGYEYTHFAWNNSWGWETPRGYSVLVTHPLNRFDLPFITLSGLVDSDKYISNGNLPFFIKEGFTGIISAGTPIAQLIPIQRKSWVHTIDVKSTLKLEAQGKRTNESNHYYAKDLRVKKEYK